MTTLEPTPHKTKPSLETKHGIGKNTKQKRAQKKDPNIYLHFRHNKTKRAQQLDDTTICQKKQRILVPRL